MPRAWRRSPPPVPTASPTRPRPGTASRAPAGSSRRWPTELKRDGRCSLSVIDAADGVRWVGLNAVVESRIDDLELAREHICELAVRYHDANPRTLAMFRSQPRVSFLLRVTRVHDHLGDE